MSVSLAEICAMSALLNCYESIQIGLFFVAKRIFSKRIVLFSLHTSFAIRVLQKPLIDFAFFKEIFVANSLVRYNFI